MSCMLLCYKVKCWPHSSAAWNHNRTRSTGTVHTSTKAYLASVAIRIRDPDRHQNLVICSLAHWQPSLKISCKSIWKFLRKVANRQTNKQRQLRILLGGGKNRIELHGVYTRRSSRRSVARPIAAIGRATDRRDDRTV